MAGGVKKRLGAQVARSRKAAGLTQEELARRVNVRMETISRLERGVSIPDLDVLDRLAGELGAPLEKLFEAGAEEPRPRGGALDRLVSYLSGKSEGEIAMIADVARRVLEVRPVAPRGKK